jgi:hypothetical protein
MDQRQIYRVEWDNLPWIAPAPGVRCKVFEQNGRKLRLAEFTSEFRELDWCRKGHVGYVLGGQGELQFTEQTVLLGPGDGIFIPAGEAHKHMLRVLSDQVRMILVEETQA